MPPKIRDVSRCPHRTIRFDVASERYLESVRSAHGSGAGLLRALVARHVEEVEAAERYLREAGLSAREILDGIRSQGFVRGEWSPAAARLARAVEDGDEALRERLLREA
jgi:hypothetical protein